MEPEGPWWDLWNRCGYSSKPMAVTVYSNPPSKQQQHVYFCLCADYHVCEGEWFMQKLTLNLCVCMCVCEV